MREGFACWFTGLSGAGKTTIAGKTEKLLTERGHRVQTLDGDEVRAALSPELGFAYEDRMRHVRRTVYVAGLLAKHGVTVLVPFITPYREMRDYCRSELPGYCEAYIRCPIEVCAERDAKGLYRKAQRGELASFTGVSDRFDEPERPDIVLHTDRETPDESAARLAELLGGWRR